MKKAVIAVLAVLALATAAWAARYSEQDVMNSVYQNSVTSLQTAPAVCAMKITTNGTAETYIAVAPIDSAQNATVWQVKKITVAGNDTTITWAGSGAFNQTATTLTNLTFH